MRRWLQDEEGAWSRPRVVAAIGLVLAFVLATASGGDEDGNASSASLPLGIAATVVVVVVAAYLRRHRWAGTAHGTLPGTVGGRELVDEQRLRLRMLAVLGLLLLVPLAVVAAMLALWGGVLSVYAVIAVAGFVFSGEAIARAAERAHPPRPAPVELQGLVQRLSVIADMPAPPLLVVDLPVATAWTERGSVHVTQALLDTLDPREQEAVIAHELAHVATRDAILMELCEDAAFSMTRTARWCMSGRNKGLLVLVTWGYGVFLSIPGAITGWLGRLLVPSVSRTRELNADAGAAALCGRPSALASALLKLEAGAKGVPAEDLRLVAGRGALGIIGFDRLRALRATHPPVAERVQRLQEMEARLQA